LSCAIVPLAFVVGIISLLINTFDFKGLFTYVKGKSVFM
jgi:hypothetical protein